MVTAALLNQRRLRRLAKALGVEPPAKGLLLVTRVFEGHWVLAAAAGDWPPGDVVLPQTRGVSTAPEAVERAEAWLAPELTRVDWEAVR